MLQFYQFLLKWYHNASTKTWNKKKNTQWIAKTAKCWAENERLCHTFSVSDTQVRGRPVSAQFCPALPCPAPRLNSRVPLHRNWAALPTSPARQCAPGIRVEVGIYGNKVTCMLYLGIIRWEISFTLWACIAHERIYIGWYHSALCFRGMWFELWMWIQPF